MNKSWKISGLDTIALWLISAVFVAHAAMPTDGIILQGTRVIYDGKEKNGVTFTVTNGTSQMYLLQSRVLSWEGVVNKNTASKPIAQESIKNSQLGEEKNLPPFIVLPPLVRFPPEEAISLRLRLTKNRLPTDRESVFSLTLKAIPSQDAPGVTSDITGAKMFLALQNNLKLFYRPNELPKMDANARIKQLKFTYQHAKLVVHNPTPYYVTLSEIAIDNKSIALSRLPMIAPYSSKHYLLNGHKGHEVSWQGIDDNGRKTAKYTQYLNHID